MVLCALISSLSEPLIAQVVGYSTAREVWTSLEALFQSQSQARLIQLQYQLATLKKGSDKATVYFCKLKQLSDTLAAAGKALSSTELVTCLLAGLGPDYDSFVTSVTTPIWNLCLLSRFMGIFYLMNHVSNITLPPYHLLWKFLQMSTKTSSSNNRVGGNRGGGRYFNNRGGGNRNRGRCGPSSRPDIKTRVPSLFQNKPHCTGLL